MLVDSESALLRSVSASVDEGLVPGAALIDALAFVLDHTDDQVAARTGLVQRLRTLEVDAEDVRRGRKARVVELKGKKA